MKKVPILLLTQVILLGSCQEKKADDPEQLNSVVVGFFDGIKTKDFQKMIDLTTPDFVIFEDGKLFNNDSLFKQMNSVAKYTAEYTFDNFHTQVDNNSGSTSYFNHGEIVLNDTVEIKIDWLESATFKKVDGKWKMNFLHSTVRK
jgi:hypothetical protein